MRVFSSPLRYPGGKAGMSEFLADLLEVNGLRDGVYAEPFAGGAGAALNLLFEEHVERIVLNDADEGLASLWSTMLHQQDALVELILETPVSIGVWKRQRQVYLHRDQHTKFELAFACFFLNRCNRSGIIVTGGPIGGYAQAGDWKLDSRYNKTGLVDRIRRIGDYRDRIEIHNMDAVGFLSTVIRDSDDVDSTLVYLDPPYYSKGSQLYLDYYEHQDHVNLADFLKQEHSFSWVLSYDDVPQIRELYGDMPLVPLDVLYCAHSRKNGRELLIHSEDLDLPYPPHRKRRKVLTPATHPPH